MKSAKKNQEMKVYGRNASLSVFENRPHDIIRAYVTQENVIPMKKLLRYMVEQKLAYHVVEKEELDALTKATHHEGVALLVKTKKLPSLSELLNRPGRSFILALESVENPHNLGAIMRTAAHFGVTGILYEAKVPVAFSGAAYRTSEGGAENVAALHLTDWKEVFELARKFKFTTYATSSHQGQSLFETPFADKSLLFLGAEGKGLSAKMLKSLDHLLSIPGSGAVESLNVSNAATAILTEWYRQGLRQS